MKHRRKAQQNAVWVWLWVVEGVFDVPHHIPLVFLPDAYVRVIDEG